jgi:hypothetical protein
MQQRLKQDREPRAKADLWGRPVPDLITPVASREVLLAGTKSERAVLGLVQ